VRPSVSACCWPCSSAWPRNIAAGNGVSEMRPISCRARRQNLSETHAGRVRRVLATAARHERRHAARQPHQPRAIDGVEGLSVSVDRENASHFGETRLPDAPTSHSSSSPSSSVMPTRPSTAPSFIRRTATFSDGLQDRNADGGALTAAMIPLHRVED